MTRKRFSSSAPPNAVEIGLSAAIVSIVNEQPRVLVVGHRGKRNALPFGPFNPLHHRTFEIGLRSWVKEQTYLAFDYAEQLYTFGDRGRHRVDVSAGARVVSVGYLALTRATSRLEAPNSEWSAWYDYFPWEDWRGEKPAIVERVILPGLKRFIRAAADRHEREQRQDRVRLCFALDEVPWNEERVLERYELLYEAGLVAEALYDGRLAGPDCLPQPSLGQAMMFDHRRILATAIARLRGKMKYRPIVFELMPPIFTLLELQRTVEAISGVRLHKQNFRRLVADQGLVERTGRLSRVSRGRPAELFRFRREVLRERQTPGMRLGTRRTGI